MAGVKDFSCIGGLENNIRIVKEMILFPLMYGEVYAKFNLRPPRGLLFYGPPGTGKTLVASALSIECGNAERKVSFISRKGSDCLSKWVGESEKKLQKIFSMAQQTKPCIIFFDEVDGLAPIRSNRQDFVHASVVSTLLALMDGLDNNSEIIVIGATNRIDAIDPALRRPGRFDRELYFPLPCYNARKEILSVHIKSWKQKPPQKFLAYLASKTVGFCGSDLQALCVEAVMCCVRRNYPQIYTSKTKHYINERQLKIDKQDFIKAQQNITPASHRISVSPVKCLASKVQPLLQDTLCTVLTRLQTLCPAGMLVSDDITGKAASRSIHCPRILLCGTDDSHTRHLGPALLHTLEHLPCHLLDVTTLFEETGRAAEEAMIQMMKAARRTFPSLLYVPDILAWWDLVDEAARVVFTSLLRGLDHSVHMLILITAKSHPDDVPPEIRSLYDERQEIFEITLPGTQERYSFFKQLFVSSNSDNMSNGSSQVDFLNMLSPDKVKTEHPNRKRKAHQVDPGHYGTRAQIKRDCHGSGEGPVTKRQRLAGVLNTPTCSYEKPLDPQMQDALQRIVEFTEQWSIHQLENIFAALEFTVERNGEGNLTESVHQYLDHYDGVEKLQQRTK